MDREAPIPLGALDGSSQYRRSFGARDDAWVVPQARERERSSAIHRPPEVVPL
jgi:hypothetical protein